MSRCLGRTRKSQASMLTSETFVSSMTAPRLATLKLNSVALIESVPSTCSMAPLAGKAGAIRKFEAMMVSWSNDES